MTKGEQIIAAVIAKITGVGGLEDVFDTTVREQARGKTLYAVVSEGDESASTPNEQTITPLAARTQITVSIVAVGGDSTDLRVKAVALLRQAQEAVQGALFCSDITFGGLVRQFIYTGAGNVARGEGESVSIVREMRFDALHDIHLPQEA
jgi:hypothetical protein